MTKSIRHPRLASIEAMKRAGQRSLRDHNLCLTFSLIASADPGELRSRADLATITGLTKATVSSLVTTLQSIGLVAEMPPSIQGVGRPPIPLTVASGMVAALGLEINVDFLGLRAVDLTGEVLDESFQTMNLRQSDPALAFAVLIRQAHDLISRLADRSIRLVGACLALPGIADHPYGPLRLAPNLGWRDIDIPRTMATAYETLRREPGMRQDALAVIRTLLVSSLKIDNEANLAARTEIGGHPDKSFIYVSGEIGIGAAIVVDGQVFSGLHGWAGEIGHIVVDPHGLTCACGATGCLEMYAGKGSLMTAAGLEPDDTIDAFLQACQRQDSRALAAIDRAVEALGIALSDCMNIVDVNRIVLGGSFACLADLLHDPLTAQITSRVLSSRWVDDLQIRPCGIGAYPAATGAALSILDQAVTDPSSPLWRLP